MGQNEKKLTSMVKNGYQLMAVSRALGIPDLLMGYEPELNDDGIL